MALRPCKECGKEVSSAAKACPHCGFLIIPIAEKVVGFGKSTAKAGCGLIALVFLVALCGRNTGTKTVPQKPLPPRRIEGVRTRGEIAPPPLPSDPESTGGVVKVGGAIPKHAFATPQPPQEAVPEPAPIVSGIDPEIEASIRQVAADRHPDNFSIQKFVIENEIAAYREIENLMEVQGVPNSVLDEIKLNAAERHPDHFGIQKFVIDNEIESYKSLHP